jgi:hypothetical protein
MLHNIYKNLSLKIEICLPKALEQSFFWGLLQPVNMVPTTRERYYGSLGQLKTGLKTVTPAVEILARILLRAETRIRVGGARFLGAIGISEIFFSDS